MMRVPACIAGILLSGLSWGVPRVLIIPQKVPVSNGRDTNISISPALAKAIDTEGRLQPIQWSAADPIFVAASSQLGIDPATPNTKLTDWQALAKAVQADYTLVVTGFISEGGVTGAIVLYGRSLDKPIWTDTKSFSVIVSGQIEQEGTGAMFAVNWNQALNEKPFKSLPRHPRPTPQSTPPPESKPTETPPTPPAQPLQSSALVIERAREWARAGRQAEAITLLLQQIDSQPLDGPLRQALIELLRAAGEQELAASEAMRYAELGESKPEALFAAAGIWLGMGNADAAADALKALRLRLGSTPEIEVLQGRVSWLSGKYGDAHDAFDAANLMKPSFDSLLGLAVCAAEAGKASEVETALSQMKPLQSTDSVGCYQWAMRALDDRADEFAAQFRQAIQTANESPKSDAAQQICLTVSARVLAINTLLEGLDSPKIHMDSHARRRLAQKLLVQAAQETLAFAKSGDPDGSAEATLSLGEALKQLNQARQQMQSEIAGR